MVPWRSLLLIYPQIDVRLSNGWGLKTRFVHGLPANEIEEAVDSFRCFPGLVNDLTNGDASVGTTIVTSERPLSTLTEMGKGMWWPSPTDTAEELETNRTKTRYDSVFVFWPQNNLQTGAFIPSAGWGLGMGASEWSFGATYATVANIRSSAWEIPLKGKVWLHEWLHGVCAHFAKQGCQMPDGDADGADRHGYVRSPKTGWTDYYRDLMNARVMEDGQLKGIPSSSWKEPLA